MHEGAEEKWIGEGCSAFVCGLGTENEGDRELETGGGSVKSMDFSNVGWGTGACFSGDSFVNDICDIECTMDDGLSPNTASAIDE